MKGKVWEWATTLYLVWLPCLWWQGLSPDQAQTQGWYIATAGLLGMSLCVAPVREPVIPWELGALWLGTVLTSLWHLQANGISTLLLQGTFAWAAIWSLLRCAPSWQWLAHRIRWMAWLNVAYWIVELAGYDPLFQTPVPVGLFSRQNHLAVLLVVAWPLSGVWERLLYGWLLLQIGNMSVWTVLLGWGAWELWRRQRRDLSVWIAGVGMAGLGLWLSRPMIWTMKAAPRLAVWKAMIAQCLMLPGLLVGYGMGAWNRLTPYPRDPYGYSVYLDIWHASGGLVLAGGLWAGWKLLKDTPRQASLSLLALAGMGLTQDVWNFTRLLILSLAVGAMVLIGRSDANPRQGSVPQVP